MIQTEVQKSAEKIKEIMFSEGWVLSKFEDKNAIRMQFYKEGGWVILLMEYSGVTHMTRTIAATGQVENSISPDFMTLENYIQTRVVSKPPVKIEAKIIANRYWSIEAISPKGVIPRVKEFHHTTGKRLILTEYPLMTFLTLMDNKGLVSTKEFTPLSEELVQYLMSVL